MALGPDAAASTAASDSDAPGAGAPGPVAQAPEELIEIQLRAILEATQTSAGAVCLFDQHQELLRLAIEVGLSDEGCRRLRSVRRGAATTWDMPLHSLLNRRVYLIESAAKNRYVPPLVDDVANVRAVACVPLYDGSTPVGSLILVALAPRSFGERQIRTLEQPVRELVGHIVSMRKRVSVAMPQRTNRPSLSAGANTVGPPAGAQIVGPSVPRITTAPAVPNGASPVQAAVDRARAELERLRARLAEAENTAATERQRADDLDHRGRELQERAAELQGECDRIKAAFGTRADEAATLEARSAELEAALADAQSTETDLRAALAEALATASAHDPADIEALQARVGELESNRAALEAALTAAQATEAALRTALADAQAIASAHDPAATETLQARLRELEAIGANAQDRSAALEATLAEARADAEARVAALAAEGDARVAAAIAEAQAQRQALVAEHDARMAEALTTATETQRRCDALDAELSSLRAAAGSQTAQAEAAAHERALWDAERTAAREREAALGARIAMLEAEIERVRGESVQLQDGLSHLESLIQTEIDTETPGAPNDPTSFEVVELDDTASGADDGTAAGLDLEMLVVEEVESEAPAPLAAAPADAPRPPAAEAAALPAAGTFVIDGNTFWTTVAAKGHVVTVIAPDAIPSFAARPERLVVNLATPGAIAALTAIRRAGIDAPCHACIVLPEQDRGVFLGRFELAERPIDPDAVLASMQGMFPRGTRVVTAGADVDGLISLRQALARLGVSVSMAWDAKQAEDLLSMVHPEVAIIDLELPPRDGCMLVARMGLVQPPPLTVVIPKATDTAAAFTTAAAHPEVARTTMTGKDMLVRIQTEPTKRPTPASGRR
jgi:CheY-like chemotaxis protein/uncharacterized small protein (DUF1192 family)